MATELYANVATTTVSSGGTTAPAGGTSEPWTVASSVPFPAAATGVSQFHVSDPAATSELITVTNVSGSTWTVTRGAESTTPVAHLAGFTIWLVVTSGDMTGLLVNANNLSDVSSASTARTNLGLGTAATQATSAFDAAGTSATETTRAEAAEALLAPKASPALTGTPTAPTAGALTNTTQLATTAYTDSAVGVEKTRALAAEALLAPLASPALTGTPTAPTKTALTNNTDIATTAYADAAVAVETSRATTAEGLALPKTGGTMSGAIAMGSNKVTGLTNGSGAQDAAAFGQLPVLSAADTSAVVAGTATAPTVRTGTLDVIAVQHPPAADWSNNSHKITSLLNGSGAQDAAAFGQIPLTDSTAAHILADGTQAAGANGKWSDSGHVHPENLWWTAADAGFLAWTGDPAEYNTSTIVAAGSVYLQRINIRTAITATNVSFFIATAGNNTGGSTGTFAGLYNSAGTLLSGSADCAASLTSNTTLATVALTTPQALSAGTFVWAALICNLGTTQPTPSRANVSNQLYNSGLAAASFRTALNGTGRTSFTTITPSSNTNTNAEPYFAALS